MKENVLEMFCLLSLTRTVFHLRVRNFYSVKIQHFLYFAALFWGHGKFVEAEKS